MSKTIIDTLAPLAMVAAMSRNRVIGRQGGIPWNHPEDMRYFRRLTTGHAVLMGRVTLDSMKRPLRDRHNLILSRRPLERQGCESFTSWEEMLRCARKLDPCPFVIGGSQIYQLGIEVATHIYLTVIEQDIEGDTYFPTLSKNDWYLHSEYQSGPLSFQTWRRKQNREE